MTDGSLLDDASGRWDRESLPPNVVIGNDCYLESSQLFRSFASEQNPGLVLGDRVRVYMGGWGGGFGILPTGMMEIGDDSVLTGVQVMCAKRILIGRRVMISYNAIIADGDFHPRDPELRRRDAVLCSPSPPPGERDPFATGPIVIGDDVRIGINAIVLKGVTLGAGSSVYAGAVVTADVPEGVSVAGNPARPVDRLAGDPGR
jgi:acetyltransferase-like isoleucine patch superfamily enzyme